MNLHSVFCFFIFNDTNNDLLVYNCQIPTKPAGRLKGWQRRHLWINQQ